MNEQAVVESKELTITDKFVGETDFHLLKVDLEWYALPLTWQPASDPQDEWMESSRTI